MPFTLALIPARGGSRELPGKNIYPLAGRPLICHSIEAARASARVSTVALSTDSAEIADIARQAGARVVMRPADLAADDTPMAPVVLHGLQDLEREHGRSFDVIVLLQPTSPLRRAEDIDCAVDLLLSSDVDSVMSVYALPKKYHPQRVLRIVDGLLHSYEADAVFGRPRQGLNDVYKANGAIYAMRRATLVEQQSVLGKRIAPYRMPLERSVDIDDWMDMRLAEALLTASREEAQR